jgi:predicted protein tyrosine phosphatase
MSTIYVCSLDEMPARVAELQPTHLISIVGPEDMPATPTDVDPTLHLRVACHDIVQPIAGEILPELDHVEAIIQFARQWDRAAPMLIHCLAGVSRSTAAALIVCSIHVEGRERQLAERLRNRAPHASPNRRMIALADEMLGRGGRLTSAVTAMGQADLLTIGSLIELPIGD